MGGLGVGGGGGARRTSRARFSGAAQVCAKQVKFPGQGVFWYSRPVVVPDSFVIISEHGFHLNIFRFRRGVSVPRCRLVRAKTKRSR